MIPYFSAWLIHLQYCIQYSSKNLWNLSHKHMEMPGCILSTVADGTLLIKHHAISTHNAEQIEIENYYLYSKHYWK